MIPKELTYKQLIEDMKACEQTKGMSVLDHGNMVRDYYHDLYFHLYEDTYLRYEWKLPNWLLENKQFILNNLYDSKIMERYQVYHDIGKPYCCTIDENSKVHFPDHANVSFLVWKKIFPNDIVVQNLIGMDMDIHLLKSEQIIEFSNRPEAISLLITGLCEIHANASIFGGIESTSFKIKLKQIDRKGKKIIELIETNRS